MFLKFSVDVSAIGYFIVMFTDTIHYQINILCEKGTHYFVINTSVTVKYEFIEYILIWHCLLNILIYNM